MLLPSGGVKSSRNANAVALRAFIREVQRACAAERFASFVVSNAEFLTICHVPRGTPLLVQVFDSDIFPLGSIEKVYANVNIEGNAFPVDGESPSRPSRHWERNTGVSSGLISEMVALLRTTDVFCVPAAECVSPRLRASIHSSFSVVRVVRQPGWAILDLLLASGKRRGEG